MIFPLTAAALQIVVNGVPVRSYRRPYIDRGRVMASVDPFLTMLSASVEMQNGGVLVRRGDRFAQAQLYDGYVAIAPVLRSLGAQVAYDAAARRLVVTMRPLPLATATPFNAAVPQAPPLAVFTPVPSPTEKPVVAAKPLPRRTPLPVISATPKPRVRRLR